MKDTPTKKSDPLFLIKGRNRQLLDEVEKFFKNLPLGHSNYQIKNFIAGQFEKCSADRAHRQCLTEIHTRYHSLLDMHYQYRKTELEIEEEEVNLREHEYKLGDREQGLGDSDHPPSFPTAGVGDEGGAPGGRAARCGGGDKGWKPAPNPRPLTPNFGHERTEIAIKKSALEIEARRWRLLNIEKAIGETLREIRHFKDEMDRLAPLRKFPGSYEQAEPEYWQGEYLRRFMQGNRGENLPQIPEAEKERLIESLQEKVRQLSGTGPVAREQGPGVRD